MINRTDNGQTVIELGDGHVTAHLFTDDGFTMAFYEHDDERYGFYEREDEARPTEEYPVVLKFKTPKAIETFIQTLAYGLIQIEKQI